MAFLILLVVVGAIAYRAMTADDRARFGRVARQKLERLTREITLRHRELESFSDALQARTPLAPVTPILIFLNVAVFVVMLFGAAPLSDQNTLVAWGGNFGPRTANGEWWRLVTALFVHSGWLHLLATVLGLMQVGLVLERLVGPLAFAAVYLAAGLFSTVVHLSAFPLAVNVGASGAIFGVYGLMLAALTWKVLRRSIAIMPMTAAKRLAPAAVMFLLYNLATDAVPSVAELGGFITGFACGLVVAGSISERKASVPRVAAAAIAATIAIAVAAAVPLQGMTDVTVEIERVVAAEERTAMTFRAALDQYETGRITAEALAEVIDRAIVPDVKAVRTRVESLDKVPREHQTLVTECKEYLRLRAESWRVRSAALRGASMPMLREADTIERASLEILRRIAAAGHA